MFLHWFKSLVRPHLEYGSVIFSPTLKKYQIMLENVQRRATRLVKALQHHLSLLSRSFSDHHLRYGGWLNLEFSKREKHSGWAIKTIYKK